MRILAEPLVVVDVDHRPRAQAKRRAVPLHPGLGTPSAGRIEVSVLAEAKRDVEQAQVAQMGLELLLPALVIARRLPGPVARALLGEIA